MINKYNIALLPRTKGTEIINLFSSFLVQFGPYRLSDKSFPHVTLLQFYVEEREVNSLWEEVCNLIENINLRLRFQKLNCTTFDQTMYWVSLIPDNQDLLNSMHRAVLSVIKQEPKRQYDPHLTLFNTKENLIQRMDSIKIAEISDDFYLSIGQCDNVGQYIAKVR